MPKPTSCKLTAGRNSLFDQFYTVAIRDNISQIAISISNYEQDRTKQYNLTCNASGLPRPLVFRRLRMFVIREVAIIAVVCPPTIFCKLLSRVRLLQYATLFATVVPLV
jgi:hypothetical protein